MDLASLRDKVDREVLNTWLWDNELLTAKGKRGARRRTSFKIAIQTNLVIYVEQVIYMNMTLM